MLPRSVKLIATFLFTLCAMVSQAAADARVALVIGNSEYSSNARLKNPANDAAAIAAKLGSIGFDVTEGYDLSYDEMRDTVRAFAGKARGADLSVFYYAGHGIAVDGENYMIPIDARISDPVDWEFEVYALNDVIRILDRSAGPTLIFLDACRDNPLAKSLTQAQGMQTRSLNTRGISRISTEVIGTSGSVIAYATEPGQVANDGTGRNSPFTTALLNHMGTANTDFAALTSLITRDVLDMTGGSQRPRFDVSLTGPLVLNKIDAVAQPVALETGAPSPRVPAAPASGAAQLEIEKIVFQTAAETGDAADYRAYLDVYPNGAFAILARNALARLDREAEPILTAGSAAPIPAATTRMVSGPLSLQASAAARALSSSDVTEAGLDLSRAQRREIQIRLNMSGNNVGAADGVIGNGTRGGIRTWQAQNGFAATGYLNAVQHQLLVANTQTAFLSYMAQNPNALNPPVAASHTTSKRVVTRKPANNDAIGAFLGGVMTGVLLNRR